MVKILGRIETTKKSNTPVYMVKRKNRTNSFDCTTMQKFGKSLYDNCSKTCDILNNSSDNINVKHKKNFSGKINFYFPVLN